MSAGVLQAICLAHETRDVAILFLFRHSKQGFAPVAELRSGCGALTYYKTLHGSTVVELDWDESSLIQSKSIQPILSIQPGQSIQSNAIRYNEAASPIQSAQSASSNTTNPNQNQSVQSDAPLSEQSDPIQANQQMVRIAWIRLGWIGLVRLDWHLLAASIGLDQIGMDRIGWIRLTGSIGSDWTGSI